MACRDLIVVGASAGGVEALQEFVIGLPLDPPAAVLIVLHVAPNSPGMLASILQRHTQLRTVAAQDKMELQPGSIYVAVPDHHLLLEQNSIRVVRGPKENRHRPAIDPLFRSAAWCHGPRVIGVVLTGTLDDGAAGLWAIKSCGGIAIVQDPRDAAYPEMPASAMQLTTIDYSVPLRDMGKLLTTLVGEEVPYHPRQAADEKLKIETEFAMLENDIREMDQLGEPSAFTCPSCGGMLWELQEGNLIRYRCHVGHAFSPDSLVAEQTETTEKSLFAALRAIEEMAATSRRLAIRFAETDPKLESRFLARATELDQSADALRAMLGEFNGQSVT